MDDADRPPASCSDHRPALLRRSAVLLVLLGLPLIRSDGDSLCADDGPARAVFEQVEANLKRIRSLEFDFRVWNRTFVPPLGSQYREETWEGHFLLGEGGCFRQEYRPLSERKSLLDAADRDGTRRILAEHLDSGSHTASIMRLSTGNAMYIDGPAIGTFLPQVWFATPGSNTGWTLESSGEQLVLQTKYRDSEGTLARFTIDPRRGYLVVARELSASLNFRSSSKYRQMRSITTLEYSESGQNIWVPVKGHYSQAYDDVPTDERTLEVIPDTVRVNSPVAESVFAITFPPGCRVVDQIARQEYLVGSAQGRAAAESMIEQVTRLEDDPSAVTPVPAPDALTAEHPPSASWLFIILALSAGLAVLYGVQRWRRGNTT